MNNDSIREEALDRHLRDIVRQRQESRRRRLSEGFVATLVSRLPAHPDPIPHPAQRRWFRAVPVRIAAVLLVPVGGFAALLSAVFTGVEGAVVDSPLVRALEAATSFALATQATMAPTDLAAIALVSITAVLLCAFRLTPIPMEV